MKVTLTFDLPDDESDHRLALNGSRYYCALFEISQQIRAKLKWAKNDTTWEEVGQLIEECMAGIELDEIP